MAGIKTLRKLQLGKESSAGTAVAATTIWRGVGTLEDQRKLEWPVEDIGYVSGLDRVYVPQLLAALAMDSVPATFEQLPYLMEASVKAVATGTADGSAGTGYKYVYALPTTAKNSINYYTIEGGDDQEAERMEYAFVESWKLSGTPGNALMMSANWKGRQVALNAFTAALTPPSVEDILFSKGKLFIDAIGGTIGTTQKSNTFLGLDMDFKSGWVPVFTADGNLYYSFVKSTPPELRFSITFEHDASGAAAKVDWRAGTARLVRLQWSGSTYATPGTGTLNSGLRTLRIDMAAKVSKVSKLGERNGNDVLTAEFVSRFNQTAAQFATVTVTNELAALP